MSDAVKLGGLPATRPKGRNAGWFRPEYMLGLVLLVEIVCFQTCGRNFGTPDNVANMVRHSVEMGLLALALLPVILTGGIDLSVGSLMGLCAVVFGKFWRDAGWPWPVAAVATLGCGALAGAFNATLITRLKLPPLIVTLGTYSLFRGLAEALTRGTDAFTNFPADFLEWGAGHFAGLPVQAWVFLGVSIGVGGLVEKTTFGRSFRAIGFSPEGARYAGLPVNARLRLVYVLAGTLAALASLTYTARLGTAKADAGTGYELVAITAVVLGGVSIFGGVGSVGGTLLGVAALAVLNNGLGRVPATMSQASELSGFLTGVLLLVALTGQRLVSWRRSRVGA